ncbi:MAG TPA: hypothetical protein VLD61_11560 [Methylomirabilota bacterium]|nr:hypothetical protein [Methylomirabilota bacterium]
MRRLWRRWRGVEAASPPIPAAEPGAARLAEARTDYAALVAAFTAWAERTGRSEVARYYWYHTVDLGQGIATPGDYDYRPAVASFGFPDAMHGMTVLDVGSATGFFAFEFERRGADVVSVELPSLADWDMPVTDRSRILGQMKAWHRAEDLRELDWLHLEGPFQFCRGLLGSRVRRHRARVDDLTAEGLGVESFDLIFVGDVLLHVFSPLQALVALAPLCRGTLIIAQHVPTDPEGHPVMWYLGSPGQSADGRSWWYPNLSCFEAMLRRLGFRDVRIVGGHRGIIRREWAPYDRTVLHALK